MTNVASGRPGAPVGVDHGGVGVDPFDIDVDVRDLVAAGHHPPVERGWDARGDVERYAPRFANVETLSAVILPSVVAPISMSV